jgi:hypothetical protein
MHFQPLHHTVVATDIVGSSAFDSQLQLKMRADLLGLMTDAVRRQGLTIDELYPADLGDGIRLHVPPTISPVTMMDPLISDLARGLRLHRKSANESTRLRLRVALHMGLLHQEPTGGWAGTVLNECARLLDAPDARALIAKSPADLIVLASEEFFDAVVRPGYAIDPEEFRKIAIHLKETDAHAWAHLPHRGADGFAPNKSAPADAKPLPPSTDGWSAENTVHFPGSRSDNRVEFHGNGHTFNGPIAGRDNHVR